MDKKVIDKIIMDGNNIKGHKRSAYEFGTLDIGDKNWWEIKQVDWKENLVSLPNGHRMYCMTLGPEDGEPIVFVHGGGDCRYSYSNMALKFAKEGYRCFVPETSGCGRTREIETEKEFYSVADNAADIAAMMDVFGVPCANFVGHSQGSLLSQTMAGKFPERVKSITLISSAVTVKNLSPFAPESYNDDMCRHWGACGMDDPEFQEGIYQCVKRATLLDWKRMREATRLFNSAEFIGNITCPVLIVWGSNDKEISWSDQIELMEGLANANFEFCKVIGGTHSMFWDSQEELDYVSAKIMGMIRAHM